MNHRSHLTQQLLNYFDHNDVRTRRTPWTLEGQLLNAAACALEESDLRVQREIQARKKGQAPLNIDNGGLWYQVQLPPSVTDPSPVVGVRGGVRIALQPYNDLLPVPTRIEFDSARQPVLMDSPLLWTLEGNGLPQNSGPLAMPLANQAYFWLEGLGDFSGIIELEVQGHPDPRAQWVAESQPKVEALLLREEGAYQTMSVWSDLTNICVRGLPSGAVLKTFAFSFALPFQTDALRTYTSPSDRDVNYPRLWSLQGSLLAESYSMNRWAGRQIVNSYAASQGPVALTLEPNTYGLLVSTPTSLLYGDRRERVPENLYRSAIAEEPLYGLQVEYDPSRPGDARVVTLTAVPYQGASNMTQYRLSVTQPDGAQWLILPSGDMAPLSNNSWFRGTIPVISLALPNDVPGTWWFTLECLDQTGYKRTDNQPYVNADFQPLASLNVTLLVPSLAAAGFDCWQRLWLWSGSFLVPVKLHYDAYIYDAGSQAVYLTDTYDEVTVG